MTQQDTQPGLRAALEWLLDEAEHVVAFYPDQSMRLDTAIMQARAALAAPVAEGTLDDSVREWNEADAAPGEAVEVTRKRSIR